MMEESYIQTKEKDEKEEKNGYIEWLFNIPILMIIIIMIYFLFELGIDFLHDGNDNLFLVVFLLGVRYGIVFLFIFYIFINIRKLK